MTEWPTYETVDEQRKRRESLRDAKLAAPQTRSSLPTWAGIVLAITVGLLCAMSVVAVSAAQSALMLRSELMVVKGEVASLREELLSTQSLLSTTTTRISTVEEDVAQMRSSQLELKERLADAQQQQPSQGLGTAPWATTNWIDFLADLFGL